VPVKALNLLARNLSSDDDVVRVSFQKNDVTMQVGDTVIYSRLVEGRFPGYRQVIPKDATHSAGLVAAPLNTAIRQASIMTQQGSERIDMRFGRSKLTVRARGPESGKSQVELPVQYDENKGCEISFNPDFVTDMLRTLEPDAALTLEMSGNKPAVFRAPNYQ